LEKDFKLPGRVGEWEIAVHPPIFYICNVFKINFITNMDFILEIRIDKPCPKSSFVRLRRQPFRSISIILAASSVWVAFKKSTIFSRCFSN